MQREFAANEIELRTRNQTARRDANRVQLAVQAGLPEVQEFLEYWKLRREIEVLPDEALQHHRMIGQTVKYFCGRQPIAAQLLLKVAHSAPLALQNSFPADTSIVTSRVEQKIEARRGRVEAYFRQHSRALSADALVREPFQR